MVCSRIGRLVRIAVAFLLATAAMPRPARAEITVPLDLQVELLLKVVRFERGFAGRSAGQVGVLLVMRDGDPSSVRAAVQLGKALRAVGSIAGKPVRVVDHQYSSPAALRAAVLSERAQLVYLTPGFYAAVPAIAAALVGVPTITVSTDGDQVDRGVILGFSLVSARPKISLNVGQARRQGLDFNSDLFRLARVVQ